MIRVVLPFHLRTLARVENEVSLEAPVPVTQRSVLDALGTEEIPRLRIGIGPDAPRADAADYVLDRFSEEEWLRLVPVLRDAVEAIDLYREGSIEAVMNRYNPRPRSIETDPDAAII